MVRLVPEYDWAHNGLAWELVLSTTRPRRDYDEALVHAREAVHLAPKDGHYANTLALAEYRSGHWAESIAASERSMALTNGGGASHWFFLAMAQAQKGQKDQARTWFDKAVAWTKEKDPKNTALRQFWTEAAELLGKPVPDQSGPGSAPASTAAKS
jgi:tetratricopeptide (TPR) repeat protein